MTDSKPKPARPALDALRAEISALPQALSHTREAQTNRLILATLEAIVDRLEPDTKARPVPVFAYTMRYRPPGYATLPPDLNWEWVEAPGNGRLDIPGKPRSAGLPWGVIATERELTKDELEQYEIDMIQGDNK